MFPSQAGRTMSKSLAGVSKGNVGLFENMNKAANDNKCVRCFAMARTHGNPHAQLWKVLSPMQ